MKTKSIILSLVLLFSVTTFCSGQIGGYLKGKVDRAVNAAASAADKRANQEIDKKAEEEVNKAADKILQDAEKKAEENKQAEETAKPEDAAAATQGNKQGNESAGGFNLGALMGGGTVTSKYRESYSFNNRIFMQAEVYDGKDVAKMDYFIYFNDESADAGIEMKMAGTTDEGTEVAMASAFIVDGTNKSFLMLTDMGGTKFGMISDVPDETAAAGQAENMPKTVITKTGNSKVIAGYKCDEYTVREEGKQEYSKVWITKDLKLKADKRTFSKAGVSPYYDTPELRDGAALAMEAYDNKGKLTMKSETKEINTGFKHSMSASGYSLRQMNFNQAGTQK